MIYAVQAGIGALGKQVLQYADERNGIEITGLVDLNPDLKGKSVNEILPKSTNTSKVFGSIKEAVRASNKKPQVAILTTLSSIAKIIPQVEDAARQGLHVVTTCEEMIYPWNQHPGEAAKINEICKNYGIACVGTGINPGFLMDYLPAVFSSICQRVDSIVVERVQDASSRRIPFQQKIGAGLSTDEFEIEKLNGSLRHVGLPESVDLIAEAIGWVLDDTRETLEPVLATERITSGFKPIEKGMPAGVEQIGSGYMNGTEVIRLLFRAAVGEDRSYDRITIKGIPRITTEIGDGVNGDVATCSITVNAVKSIITCTPGLKTMLDIPVPAYFSK